jgi:hypothetical protein
MDPITLILVTTIAPIVITFLSEILPARTVKELLFNGEIRNEHKTKYALTITTDRYKDSIKGFNQAVAFNVGFAVIAFYGYIALPPTAQITIPLIGFSVSRLAWITIVPLISYGLQTLIFTTFIWFMVLRLGIKLLYEAVGVTEDFGDVTNILLEGTLGQMWIILRVTQLFKSKWNLVWAIPVLLVVFIIVTSPLLICIYFIVQLLALGRILLGVIYGIFLIPYAALFLLLLATAAILGLGEFSYLPKNTLPNNELLKTLDRLSNINSEESTSVDKDKDA